MAIGRNDPCFCGSGKKYKQCCLNKGNAIHLARQSQQGLVNTQISNALKLATEYFEAGNLRQAIQICQQILQSNPNHDAAMTLLGTLAYYAGNVDAAVNLFKKSLALNPQQVDAHNNLAMIYIAEAKLTFAFPHLEKALQLNPKHIGGLINYGNALQEIYEYEKAIEIYEKVLKIDPKHAGALSNLGNILQQLYRHESAIEIFTRLIEIDPDYDWALGGLLYSKAHCCHWGGLELGIKALANAVREGKRAIKVFELRPLIDDPELELICARTFSAYMYPQKKLSFLQAESIETGRIKIAYLSADFREHPVSQLLVEVLEKHDREKFEIIGISFGPDDQSNIRERMIKAFDQFLDVREKSDEEIARLLQSLNASIAVDLMGYTTHARPAIFSYHAVPHQVSFLGYAGTTGSADMDYIIGDKMLIPESKEQYYSEKVVRLPQSFLPRDTSVGISKSIPTRSAFGLPDEAFVFCAFNNHYKITPQVFAIWMRLLSTVKGSVLWLSQTNNLVKENLWREAATFGIVPERIIFAERMQHLGDHIARHALADLFLDTLPYNAHTTASDALWAGLPVLTCAGHSFAARVAASLLHAADMPELVTETLDEYEKVALRLANNPNELAILKQRLNSRKTESIFNIHQYVKNLENAYTEITRIGSLK